MVVSDSHGIMAASDMNESSEGADHGQSRLPVITLTLST